MESTPEDLRPIFVGEANPYGSPPEYALFPVPERSAGGRLCHVILGMRRSEYLSRFERRNLCAETWRVREAREAAAELAREAEGRTLILLGAKVSAAFEVTFEPYTVLNNLGLNKIVILPHPSGLCRLWQVPGAVERARATLRQAGVNW